MKRGVRYFVLPFALSLTTAIWGCSKSNPVGIEVPNHNQDIPQVIEYIDSSVGGFIESEGYRVEFPPNSLSEDVNVVIGSAEENPNYPVENNLEIASSFLDVNLGSASLTDTCFVYIQSNYNMENPKIPILFDSVGNPIGLPQPSFDEDNVKFPVYFSERDGGFIVGLFDLIDEIQGSMLNVPENFDFNSIEDAVILIPGMNSNSSVFNEENDPNPTLHEFSEIHYPERVFTFDYRSLYSVDFNGSELVEAINEFKENFGDELPFKFDIIAHSMGGLVTRDAIRKGLDDYIDDVILIGTPNNGTPLDAAVHYLLFPPGRGFVDWFNIWSFGFQNCLTGSDFLNSINTTTPNIDVDYHFIAGNIANDNPFISGADDGLVGNSSVDLHNVNCEGVRLHQPKVVNLSHGRLVENRSNLFSVIEECLFEEPSNFIETTLAYDNGSITWGHHSLINEGAAVRFTSPEAPLNLLGTSIYLDCYDNSPPVDIVIFDGSRNRVGETVTIEVGPYGGRWYDVDLSHLSLTFNSNDFYVGVMWTGTTYHRAYLGFSNSGLGFDRNFKINYDEIIDPVPLDGACGMIRANVSYYNFE